LTIVPFAIPVAVPVATISQPAVFYGYSQYRLAAKPPGPLPSSERPPALTAASVLRQRCAACHAGPNPKGRFSVEATTGDLASDERLEIVDRVTSSDPQRRMPPDGPALAPDELRALLRELVR
jgi:hypothetical protein